MPTVAGEKSAKDVKNISNPRRLLILSPASHAQSTIPSLLHSLTGVPVSTPPQTTTSATTESSNDLGEGKEKEKNNHNNEEEGQATVTATTTTTTTTTTFAGYTTHAPFRIQTKYYTAEVPIWVDEVPLLLTTDSSPSNASSENTSPYPTSTRWKDEFLGADARVVRDAIGAVVLCVRNPEALSSAIPEEAVPADELDGVDEEVRALKDLIKVVGEVKGQIEEERGGMGEVPTLLVLASSSFSGKEKEKGKERMRTGGDEVDEPKEEEKFGVGWWEDELYDMGVMEFEVVEWDPKKKEEENGPARRNPYGELEGIPRIKEVLEATDWSASSYDQDGSEDNNSEAGFDFEVNELGREMMGLRFAIENGGGDGDDFGRETDNNFTGFDDDDDDEDREMKVEALETLMIRMQAIKDMSAELPEHERKSFAAKAVRDIMKEL
ncbi:hypothetical protein DTO166G4_6897 [Paecilomyces variotii]|nr:hypothetical protein DTO166G4_6897 [Paecilomyces variotii]KAJ9237684.1 hypothetical protein DTO166G5_3448 [Paecilomyces variotii]KAJ9261277.1 hypothetical protein DTO195F2_4303 [Paecilomyces variotii]KAJ9372832.1 hypothetical protein DTO282E5_2559 [Paecilomyces variotii]